jgi:hypothetical protein
MLCYRGALGDVLLESLGLRVIVFLMLLVVLNWAMAYVYDLVLGDL